MHLALFSPLGMLAQRAIYFADVFFLYFSIFSGRLRSNEFSGTTGRIFTNFSWIGRAI